MIILKTKIVRNIIFYNLLFFMIACMNVQKTEPSLNTELTNQCVALLHHTMYNQERWIKVHAAEYLVWLGNSEEVQKVFLEEEKKNGEVSGYRVGIWRVLYQSASPEQKKYWMDKILGVFLDTTATDRVFAIESLAKLKISTLNEYPVPTQEAVMSSLKPLSMYASWSISFSSSDSLRAAPQRLITLIKQATDDLSKIIGAYAIRNIRSVTKPEWEKLAHIALAEPDSSSAKVFLLSAAFVTAAENKGYNAGLLSQIYETLLSRRNIPSKAERMETSIAIAENGTEDDLTGQKDLMKNVRPIGRAEDDADVSAAAAYAIVKISRRMDKP